MPGGPLQSWTFDYYVCTQTKVKGALFSALPAVTAAPSLRGTLFVYFGPNSKGVHFISLDIPMSERKIKGPPIKERIDLTIEIQNYLREQIFEKISSKIKNICSPILHR